MANTAYLYEDWIKDLGAAAIAITNEDTNYPEANLQNEQIALRTWTTDKVGIKFQFDLGSAKQPQAFAILNHNFSGGTFDINSYTANDYSTGKTTVEDDKAVRLLDVYHREASAPTARRYWEFDFTNCTSADSVFKIGRLIAYSDFTQLQQIPDVESSRSYGYRNIINETPYGIRWVHKLSKNQERFTLNWSIRTDANVPAELKTLFEAVYGDAHPFVFVPNLANTACYYVYCAQSELPWTEIEAISSDAHPNLITDISIELIEAIRGKV